VEVFEHDPAGWSRVQVGNSTGFIRSDFLKAHSGSSPATFSTTAGVNIRATASIDSKVLSTIVAGASVEVLEHDPAGWSRVRVDDVTGFIRSDFLSRLGAGTQAAAVSATEQAMGVLKTTGNVNLRSSSSTDADIIRTLAADTSVDVLANDSNGWSRVSHNGTDGFIRSDLLSESGASSGQAASMLKTTGNVNLRSGTSTNTSIIRTLSPNTSVEVLAQESNGWSRVSHNGTSGFIRSDLISEAGAGAGSTLKTVTGVNLRSGPSTNHNIIRLLTVNTNVEVLERQSNGWSRVSHNGTTGFIRSDLLGAGGLNVELSEYSEIRRLLTRNATLRVVDVRTGISYNIRTMGAGGPRHVDVDTASAADTDAKLRSRSGVWAWAPRPVWVTIDNRTFAAAINGMPHGGSSVSGNGLNGHFCIHFRGSTPNGPSATGSYQRNMQNAVTEAWERRPQ